MSEILYCKKCGDEIENPDAKEVIQFLYTHKGHEIYSQED